MPVQISSREIRGTLTLIGISFVELSVLSGYSLELDDSLVLPFVDLPIAPK
jgi:hypothetical protein